MKIIPLWAYVAFSAIVYAFAEYCSKIWGNRPSAGIGAAVILLYGASTFGWLGIMAHKNQLFVMGLAWQVMVTVVSATVGLAIFSEKLSPWQWAGAAAAVVSIALLMMEA